MKKKYLLISIIFIIICILTLNTKSYAQDTDKITDYVVTVDPRMSDGSLDIMYEITWEVLDSSIEGPLTWVQIGTPNEYFDNATALSNNIKSIKKYNGSYVRIDFNKEYNAGEKLTFKYKIHQPYMHKVSWGQCVYKFTPAWFTDISIDSLKIKWNSDQVKKSDTKSTEGGYLVWYKNNMDKGKKLTINVKYDKSAFSSLNKPLKNNSVFSMPIIVFFIIFLVVCAIPGLGFRRRLLWPQRILWRISQLLWWRLCK